MSNRHFFFGLMVGFAVITIGLSMATLGAPGIHLAFVGAGISLLTIVSKLQEYKNLQNSRAEKSKGIELMNAQLARSVAEPV